MNANSDENVLSAEEIERVRSRDREWAAMQPTDFLPTWSRERLADAYFLACLDRHWLLATLDETPDLGHGVGRAPSGMRYHWLSTERMTIAVGVDESGVVRSGPPIVRKFVGQPLANLVRWMERQPGFVQR